MIKQRRITVVSWTDQRILADGVEVENPGLIPAAWLYPGAQLNLLLCEVQPDGALLPQHIVLDPDFLVDVTTICRCFTHHGDAPAMHLMQKFCPSPATAAILLGNVANQFLDDCVNAPADADRVALYRDSLRRAFRTDALRFATTDGIDQAFANQCRLVFDNIWETVHTSLPQQATLESAFLCEALGIQGRMDMMSTDHHTVVELKSGRAERDEHYRYEHAMQMALYKESLYYNEGLPYARVQALLFYARYPQLFDIRLGREDIHRAMAVRNGIVHIEHLLRRSPALLLDALTEAHFNTRQADDRFYHQYLRPPILSFLNGLRTGTPLAREYFHAMLAFVEREQFLAKTGIEGVNIPVGHGGFADTWRTDLDAKLRSGRIIPDLRLTPILSEGSVVAVEAVTDAIDESSNFRVGDMVMLYAQDTHRHPAAFYTSCIIEHATPSSLTLRLRFPQHDASVFCHAGRYAIEPAHADSGYTVLYRGLYAFLGVAGERQQLLLGQRPPRTDATLSLRRPIPDAHLRDIVLRARQALDYFLLVGPPGTGKTNVALRLMVQEYMTTPSDGLLLMAFTNRAVDEICSMLATIHVEYLRLGPELSCAPEHRDRLLTTLVRSHPTRTAIRQLLQHTPILVGTIASLSSLPELFRLRHFRAAIIDEASQALEPHLLPLFCATDARGRVAIDKFILIGDHKQLPAVVQQSVEESAVTSPALRAACLTDCRRSLFERLHELANRQGVPAVIGLLHRQGRMHQDIAAFVSHHYYNDELQPVPLPHQSAPLPDHALFPRRLVAINVEAAPSQCTAKSNCAEAERVADIVAAFSLRDWQQQLGIIVPFRGQITQIRRALAERAIPGYDAITIDTVERYQGSQRDIIIFSTTVSAPWQLPILSQPVETGGQLIDRKLNVAITRARHQFILVGNHPLLRRLPAYTTLLDYIAHAS
ncbi:MAG: AAA family ATPase [Bacteroidaceae bacterium]|nr:AAA family ATPase [Bacteroidaceae bacterium]